jgi:hypothetical protein
MILDDSGAASGGGATASDSLFGGEVIYFSPINIGEDWPRVKAHFALGRMDFT